jgi:hypothetical protein
VNAPDAPAPDGTPGGQMAFVDPVLAFVVTPNPTGPRTYAVHLSGRPGGLTRAEAVRFLEGAARELKAGRAPWTDPTPRGRR